MHELKNVAIKNPNVATRHPLPRFSDVGLMQFQGSKPATKNPFHATKNHKLVAMKNPIRSTKNPFYATKNHKFVAMKNPIRSTKNPSHATKNPFHATKNHKQAIKTKNEMIIKNIGHHCPYAAVPTEGLAGCCPSCPTPSPPLHSIH